MYYSLGACILLALLVNVDASLTVDTQYGPVTGLLETTGPHVVRSFRGIPYAKPPVGSLRWHDPVAPDAWTTPLQATEYGYACPQHCDLPPHTCPARFSEDCLFLNVWTPVASTISTPLNVLFFIHGGHFEQGSGEGPFYDSSAAANVTDVVVVTINYRLGALGWLNSGDGQLAGNYGLKDQIMALKWVNSNIHNFGGDPNKIMIYGQSAGGTSVSSILVSPAAKGLFQSAVIESNPFGLPMMSLSDGAKLSERLTKDAGCGDTTNFDCLMSKSADDIVTAQAKAGKIINFHDLLELFYPWTPTIDQDYVPDQPLNLFMKGAVAPVPIMLGTVEDEGRLFIWMAMSKELSELEYGAVVTFTFGLNFLKVLSKYPAHSGDNRAQLAAVATDYLFACPARAAARGIVDKAQQEAYLYQFDYAFTFPGWGPNYTFCEGYVCHGEELPFVFNIADQGVFTFSQTEKDLATAMMTAWSNHGKTGSPKVANWPAYSSSSDVAFRWQTPVPGQPVTNLKKDLCDFWDSIGYKF